MCNQNGSPLKTFFPDITGKMTFSQRKTLANNTKGQVLPDLMSKRDYNYTPQINKLKGYSQMPNPVVRIDSLKKLARSVSIYFLVLNISFVFQKINFLF